MIAGFNTDIEYDGTVYHIQTEDKGAPAHMIMTLVYDKGTILASKRSNYDDVIEIGFDEKEITDRLNRQHKLMCAAVKAGRISDLVAMTRQASAAAAKAKLKPEPAVTPGSIGVQAMPSVQAPKRPASPMPQPSTRIEPAAPRAPISISIVDPAPEPVFEEVVFEELPVIDAVQIIEDIEILPDEAVAVVSELSGQERPTNNKLSLELLGESKFRGGERKTITVMICRGTDRKVVSGAQILVKVLGSAFRPVIFHARSDTNGLARVHLQLPKFSAGRAALLVRVVAGGEEIELRRIVTPG